MIEWIQHWDEMRFHYWSPFNWFIVFAPRSYSGQAWKIYMPYSMAKKREHV